MLNQCIKLIRLENIVIFLISIFTIFRYQGLIAPYLHSKFYDNNSSLNEDIYFNNQHETFVYDFINFNYTNDYLYFCFYIFVCATGYIFTFKILKKYSILSNQFIYFTLLALSGLDGFIAYDVKSSLSPFNQSPSTMLSWSLFPVTIYFLLEKRIYLLSIIVFFNILISIKFGLFPSIIALFYNLINEEKFKKKVFLLFPIILSFSSYFLFKSDIAHENIYNDINIIENIISNTGDLRDFLILEQRYIHLLLSSLSFLIFYLKIKITDRLSNLFKLIFLITILMIIFHIIYFEFIFKHYPDIRLFMLSAVANFAFYQFIFVILLIHIIFKLDTNILAKSIFIFSIIYWNGEEHLWISKKISISLFCFALSLYFIEKFRIKIRVNNSISTFIIIILFFPIILANFYRFNSTFSSNLMLGGNTKLFSNVAGIHSLENLLTNLKKCENISTLVFYKNSKFVNTSQHYLSLGKYPSKRKDIYYPSYSANILAQKSFFYEPNGRLFKKKIDYIEHYKRSENFKKIYYELNNGKINIKNIQKEIKFPFLIVLGDNINNQFTQIYFVNKDLISNIDINCYKNL